jgi:outer membrane biosynthesis protein TonB
MEELMTAVFVAHTKVLTAVRLSTKQKKLSITVPKLDHFIHRIFRESARSFWKAPFLFVSEGNVVDRQKNLLQIEGLATEAITTAVRGLLPVKQILNDYLGEDQEEEPVSETIPVPEPEPVQEPKVEPIQKPKVEPVQEPKVEPVQEPKVEPVQEPKAEATTSVVSIDTEPTVRFSQYESVFDDTKAQPEIRYVPNEDDEYSDALQVDESTTTHVSKDDFEDLEAPVKKEVITDDEVVVLD